MADRPDELSARDESDNAIRDLVGAGLVHRHGAIPRAEGARRLIARNARPSFGDGWEAQQPRRPYSAWTTPLTVVPHHSTRMNRPAVPPGCCEVQRAPTPRAA